MLKPRSLIRSLVAIGSLCGILMLGAIGATPASAYPGECVGAGFTADPKPGAKVKSGETIVYTVTVQVTADYVLACSRDIRTSPLLEFVSIEPNGDFFPEATSGPTANVNWSGPVYPGTVLQGSVTMRVRCGAPDGAVIESSSGPTIQHFISAKKHCTPQPT